MFYLETKDGERFLTNSKSDDKAEFEKILEQKLGKDAVELFNHLLDDAKEDGQKALAQDLDYVITQLNQIRYELYH